MKKIILAIFALATIGMISCSGNNRAKNYRGTETINLPAGQKLITITWKDNSIWYLTQPMKTTDAPVTSRFQEKSSKGMLEGTVIINESK